MIQRKYVKNITHQISSNRKFGANKEQPAFEFRGEGSGKAYIHNKF